MIIDVERNQNRESEKNRDKTKQETKTLPKPGLMEGVKGI